MKKSVLVIIGVLIFNFVNGQTKIAVNGLDTSKNRISKKQADLIFEKVKVFPNNTEVSLAIIKKGKLSFYGVKRLNDTLIYSENSNSVFEIGSLSKVFTSTLLSNFVSENRLDLNAPIQKYFNLPIKNKEITVLQLANHTSGLPKFPSNLNLDTADPKNPTKDYDEDKLKEYLTEKLEILNTPGSTYEYSNIGVGILGYLLEVQSHKTYEELIQEYIFSKYNMRSSTTKKDKIKTQLVGGLDKKGKKTPNWDLNALVGAGGVLSNVNDLSKFALAQFNPKNKELELTRQSTFEDVEMEVGLGWKIIKPEENIRWHAHNGGTGGYSSMIALDLEEKNGVIILSNVSTFNKNTRNIDFLTFFLMKTLLTE